MLIDDYVLNKDLVSHISDVAKLNAVKPKADNNALFDVVEGSLSSINISTFAKQINSFYQSLKTIADPELRNQALSGLSTIVANFHNSEETYNFISELDQIREQDSSLFASFFQTANSIDQTGFNLAGWITNFVDLGDNSLRQSYLNESNNIVNSDFDTALKQETFANFVATTSSIIHHSGETISQQMGEFFNQIKDAESLEEKIEVSSQYRQKSNNSDK